jgi:transcriptional regulator with XRE-family HTH domain
MTSEGGVPAVTPGELVRERLRSLRKQRRMNPDQAAESYADPAMSATVLMNIEAGRRRTPVTVDELVRFAYVLDVPLDALLHARDDRSVRIAEGVAVDPAGFLRWMRGEQPLAGTDVKLYEEASAAVAPTAGLATHDLREEFLSRAQAAFDTLFTDSEEILAKTRQQMLDVLTEVRDAAASGAPTADLLSIIDGFLDRMKR